MSTTLITILGRTPKDANGYRPTRYTFSDQSRTEPLAFFGWALQQQIHPQRMVVLGTDGSMWDHLFEGDIDLEQDNPEERLALIEATEKKQVTQEQLDRLTPHLEARIGCEVKLALIPYARDEVEQVELLRRIATHVPQEETVHLDVTHGFRHLPMLSLLAALYLRIARKAHIEKIWYAAYDPDTQQAPVLDLSGLLRIADGLQALSSFDKDGDYGVFIPILQQAGLPTETVTALQKAAYYENILNVGESTGQLRCAREGLGITPLQPETEFLLPVIRDRLAWFEEGRQFQKLTKLARSALDRHDYLRAILYAYETVITKLCQHENVPVQEFEKREQAQKAYETRPKSEQEKASYKLLKNLRNQVSHGSRGSTQEVQQALLNEDRMRDTLDRLLKEIEDGKLPSANT